jgi:hypothetical protein
MYPVCSGLEAVLNEGLGTCCVVACDSDPGTFFPKKTDNEFLSVALLSIFSKMLQSHTRSDDVSKESAENIFCFHFQIKFVSRVAFHRFLSLVSRAQKQRRQIIGYVFGAPKAPS